MTNSDSDNASSFILARQSSVNGEVRKENFWNAVGDSVAEIDNSLDDEYPYDRFYQLLTYVLIIKILVKIIILCLCHVQYQQYSSLQRLMYFANSFLIISFKLSRGVPFDSK